MKKIAIAMFLAIAGVCVNHVNAQKEQGLFNRWGIGVSASTLGIGIDASTTISPYFMLRAGVDIMPGITFDTDVDVDVANAAGESTEVNVEGDLKRTQVSLLLNVYPFKKSSFFIAGGCYFGGDKLVTIKGDSPELRNLWNKYGEEAGLVIGDYTLPIGPDGTVSGGLKVSKVRPYLGIGFGRAVPHKRLGFMWELGVQFHGTPEVYSDHGDVKTLINEVDTNDDFSDIMDKLTVYPVMKFRLCGRIF